jgi:hypothetical protein
MFSVLLGIVSKKKRSFCLIDKRHFQTFGAFSAQNAAKNHLQAPIINHVWWWQRSKSF